MKKRILWLTGFAIVVAMCAYWFYNWYVPKLVTEAILNPEKELPSFVPDRVKRTIRSIETQANKRSATVLAAMHDSGVTLEEALAAIDEIQEDHVYAALEELNNTDIVDIDQAFDIAKKHIRVDQFDVEKLRGPYRKFATLARIQRGLKAANKARDTYFDDPEMVRMIAKKLLVEKEKEFRTKLGIPG